MLTPFGQVVVPTPGTPVRVTVNLDDPSLTVPVQSFVLQVRPENTGLVYIFQGGANFAGVDDRATRRRCIGILPAPASAVNGPFASASFSVPVAPAALNAGDVWIDVSVAGNGVIVSGLTG